MLDNFLNFFTSIVVAVLASYLTVRFSLRKFYTEKWWERKCNAYIGIIESLHDIILFLEIKQTDYGQGTGLSVEKEKEIQESYKIAYQKVKKATDIGSFLISKDAEDILIELRNRPTLDPEEYPWFEIYDEENKHHIIALTEFIKSAKTDLKVEKI